MRSIEGESTCSRGRSSRTSRDASLALVGIHMVGDNNNLGRTPEQDAEYRERDAANLAWL